jgi:hypothetical protein
MTADVDDRRVDPAPDVTAALFASGSVVEHVVRGIVGLVLAVLSLVYAGAHPWALLGLVAAVIAWRGCPTCWALGLAATVSRGRTSGCDGQC